jgi:hypothetical protein
MNFEITMKRKVAITLMMVFLLIGCGPMLHTIASDLFIDETVNAFSRISSTTTHSATLPAKVRIAAWCVDNTTGGIRAEFNRTDCTSAETSFTERREAEAQAQIIGGPYSGYRICLKKDSLISAGIYGVPITTESSCAPDDIEFTSNRMALFELERRQTLRR